MSIVKVSSFASCLFPRYSRGCKACDDALQDLETIDDDAEKFNIEFVKINNKRLAKSYGINDFPTLTFFKDGQIQIFTGEISGAEQLQKFQRKCVILANGRQSNYSDCAG